MPRPVEECQRGAIRRLLRRRCEPKVPPTSLSRRRLLRRLWELSLYLIICTAGRGRPGPGLPARKEADRPCAEDAAGSLAGRVVDLVTGEPLAGVRLSAGGAVVHTGDDGRYTLRPRQGPWGVSPWRQATRPQGPWGVSPWRQATRPQGTYQVRATHPAYIGMTRAYVRVAAGIVQALDWEMIPTTPDEAAQAVIEEKLRAQRQEQPEATPQAGWLLAEAFVAISEPPATLRVLMPDGTVQVMVMEEYLRGVVPAEMPASWPLEALRAQAVAARSYASTRRAHRNVGADVCTTTHCQVWRAVYYDRTDQAVRETRGVVGRYDGLIIEAYYFAHCDGRTRNSEEVWIRALPYCRSVLCPCGNTRMRGHGVGMCQHGARTMALRGRDYRQILTHYYTGISVSLPPTLDRRVYLPLVMGP